MALFGIDPWSDIEASVSSMQGDDLRTLREGELFRDLGAHELIRVIEAGEVLRGPLNREWNAEPALFVALRSRAELRDHLPGAESLAFGASVLGPGQSSSLASCYENAPRVQSLVLADGARVLRLTRAALDRLVREHPRLGREIVHQLARRLQALDAGLRDALDLELIGDNAWRRALVRERYEALYAPLRPTPGWRLRQWRLRFVSTYYRHPVFWMLLGFVLAIVLSRLVVGTILAFDLQHKFFNLIATADGSMIHIHHFNYGLALLALSALALLMPGVRGYILPLAFVYGVGLGLFIDEFGLVMNLNPDYFQVENNIAMGVTGAVFIVQLYRVARRREPPP